MGIKLFVEVQDLCDLYVIGQDSADTDDEQNSFIEDENFLLQEFISNCEDSGMKLLGISVSKNAGGFDAYMD